MLKHDQFADLIKANIFSALVLKHHHIILLVLQRWRCYREQACSIQCTFFLLQGDARQQIASFLFSSATFIWLPSRFTHQTLSPHFRFQTSSVLIAIIHLAAFFCHFGCFEVVKSQEMFQNHPQFSIGSPQYEAMSCYIISSTGFVIST